jgi:hypothetical protein
MAKKVRIEKISEPLNGATTVKFEINVGDGNLVIDAVNSSEQVLASGTLEYLETQGLPTHTLATRNGQSILTLKAGRGRQPWIHFPWSGCNGATEWKIHLNPTVPSEITAHSNGGNVKLDLSAMVITCVSAETGGGNVDVVLPDGAADLDVVAGTGGGNITVELGRHTTGSNVVNAKSGAGNVIVYIPGSAAARIYATTGLGKVIIDPRFSKIADNTYQSSDFDHAVSKVEIIAQSGAGNVSVDTR